MWVSGISRIATAEAITKNDEQSVNKERPDIFSSTSLLRPFACKRSERKARAIWWRWIYLKAEMISRGWIFLLCQLVTCLWRPFKIWQIKKRILDWSQSIDSLVLAYWKISMAKWMRCKRYDCSCCSVAVLCDASVSLTSSVAPTTPRKGCEQNCSKCNGLLL